MATSSRRVPLASLSNATNSPHRSLTHSGTKRPRSLANLQQENEPPQKRAAVEKSSRAPATPLKQSQPPMPEGRVFERSNGKNRSTAFQQKLVAAQNRDKTAGSRVTRNAEGAPKEDNSMKTWQRQYRKLFPTFRFYFDGFSDEAKSRFLRPILALGGHEENFFSKDVTHIVTTRQIPAEAGSAGENQHSPTDDQPQTINPSLLEKNPRGPTAAAPTRNGTNQMDILVRGRDMGIKIYSVDKLQRLISSMLATADNHGHNTRGSAHTTRHQREDLGEVLRNEKLGAASEKELPLTSLVPFKGPFVYIHDMDEKYRPTMMREYPKPATRAEGDWPQFRSAGVGKCPFVVDPNFEQEQRRAQKRAQQQEQQRQLHQRRDQQIPRTRSHVIGPPPVVEAPRRVSPRKPLAPVQATAKHDVVKDEKEAKSYSSTIDRQPSFPPMPKRNEIEFVRPAKLQLAREPAASGIQRSNLTSAIQSQMVSSTAATGVKAGTSREVHQQLKRQVLERTHTGSLSVGSIPSSHRMTDLAGALKTARAPAPQRAAKSKAQEKLGGIQEEVDPHEDDLAAERAAHASRKKKAVRKDPKPGYCENCHDKYDDFDEHVVSRKHRKFAMTQSNWTELDHLLAKLQDP
ncbi:Cdc7p-Dbf4p kinase complex regulatory subunit [Cladophialophora chaetospira]|uniref:Cdc7p-Dbf4p kinase complex regulatory subunit n=1 Tax=Cladophialophora chaetospira TaxID=386627 RepID=A0AA39CG65_9EURO|nr:Cdc7p-Dbf4p kinase complex regulatory subunit [Cladophialophora chaetospira]